MRQSRATEHGLLSVFPMDIGVAKMLQLIEQGGLSALRDQRGILLNLEVLHRLDLGTT